MATKVQSNQLVNEAALSVMRQAARAEGDDIFAAIDQNFGSPFRMYGSNPYDAVLNLSASEIKLADGSGKSAPPLSSQVFTIPLSTINFQTGATTGATFDGLTFPASTVGRFRRLGLTLIGSGQIKALWSAEAVTLGAVANPGTLFVKTGVPIGWIDLEATGATAFKTAGSSSSIVENEVGGVSRIHIFGSGGAGGSGSGGSGTLQPEAGYRAILEDLFSVPVADPLSNLRSETTASYNTVSQLYQMLCDKSKFFTTVGTAYTISAAPTFTVVAGDIIYDNAQAVWRRIASVTTPTTGVLVEAFPVDLVGSAGMVSQAIHTKDLVNIGDPTGLTGELPFSSLFGATNQPQTLVSYRDSLAVGDAYGDDTSTARVVVSASNSGVIADVGLPLPSTYAPFFARPTFPNAIADYILLGNATRERLFLTFFCNPSNGSVTAQANLLRFKVSMYPEDVQLNGGVLQSAYCWTNSANTPVGCSNPTTISDPVYAATVSQITLNWSYVMGVRPGLPEGDLDVYLEGAKIPRYYVGVGGLSYREIAPNVIRLSQDFSASNFSVHVQKRIGSPTAVAVSHYDAIVGSAAQVTAGIATHSSIVTALGAVPVGGAILVLNGTYAESPTLSNQVTLEGQGRATIITGNLVVTADYCKVGKLRIDGNITLNVGADRNDLSTFWCAGTSVVTNNGTANYLNYIQG